MSNTPTLKTERLILRRFTQEDIPAIFAIFSHREVNRFLPWFPVKTMDEAREFYRAHYVECYERPQGYFYAVCQKEDNVPVGYMGLGAREPYDLGYGLRLAQDGLPYVTAAHDRNNSASGRVMEALGMTYRYSYREQWQLKNIPVVFRMYQLNLNGDWPTYMGYWEKYPEHFVEDLSIEN